MATFEEYFGTQKENPEGKLKAMNQYLNYCADEDDYVTPKYRLLGIVVDIDGGIAVN